MRPALRISLFCVVAIVLYLAMIAPGVPLARAYAVAFRAGGNLLLHDLAVLRVLGVEGRMRFEATPQEPRYDTLVRLERLTEPTMSGSVDVNAAFKAFTPVAFFAALTLASPIPWRRKLTALLVGLLLVQLFVYARFALFALDVFSSDSPLAVVSPAPALRKLLVSTRLVLYSAPEITYVVPVAIWLLVAFRRSDWRRLMGRDTPPETGETETTTAP